MLYFSENALIGDRWARDVQFRVTDDGFLTEIEPDSSVGDAEILNGIVIPGMPNLHSHAFQRAMAGRSETASGDRDNFWSWRETMYQLAEHVSPDELKAIATQLYKDMIKSGYTSVAEFHYLHHDLEGKPYTHVDAMSRAIISAACDSGINLMLAPVLYMTAGFDRREPAVQQKRFILSVESYIELFDKLLTDCPKNVKPGLAFHSLRAVPVECIQEILAHSRQYDPCTPIHIHIAEQKKEVDDCIATNGRRPVEYLLDNIAVDARWCLVHATHVQEHEVAMLAETDAVVGLCPTTEANLGDGIFPVQRFFQLGGKFGIGSDSHVCLNPAEELRLLEYVQRLLCTERNIIASDNNSHTGTILWLEAVSAGAQACGQSIGGLQTGARADLLVLDKTHPLLRDNYPEYVLDTFVFSENGEMIKDVMVAGQWRVRDGEHLREREIDEAFHLAMSRLNKVMRNGNRSSHYTNKSSSTFRSDQGAA